MVVSINPNTMDIAVLLVAPSLPSQLTKTVTHALQPATPVLNAPKGYAQGSSL